MSDAQETLGTLIDENAGRDAIHVAVFPAVAGERLAPGQHVGKDGSPSTKPHVGIVDPFLAGLVFPGERFWVLLYPRTITGLRHVWTHPAFGDEVAPIAADAKATSEKWLRDYIDRSDCPSYEEVIGTAVAHLNGNRSGWGDKEYLHFNGQDAHGEIPDEFWEHFEVVTGMIAPQDDRPRYFSCGC